MRLRPLACVAAAVVTLTGCLPATPTPTIIPTPTASVSGAPRTSPPSRAETREPTPSPDATLPTEFPITGSVAENAETIVAELHRVAGGHPALKLDVTGEQVTLTTATPEASQRSYRWRDGVVAVTDSDVRNLGQTTFDPSRWPLATIPSLLDVASLMAGSSRDQVLQVVQYHTGDVYLTVTTRPESRTIFFRQDGTAVRKLGLHSVTDIRAGLAEVTASSQVVLSVGFNHTQGYWADVPKPGGVIERRTRMGTLPMFSSQRQQTLGITPFDPALLDAAAIAMAIAQYRTEPDEQCSIEVDNRFDRVQPVIRYDCAGTIHYSDLNGSDMTPQFSE